ncbi:MAG: MATE family efflux transporter [Syntrophaceae bacterium]
MVEYQVSSLGLDAFFIRMNVRKRLKVSEIPGNQYKSESGSVREMVAVALPMVVSLSCDTLMIFTDRLFLAKLSPEAMNAAMGGGIASFQCMSFFVGLIGYTTALVAQQYGAGERARASLATFQAVLVALAVWPLLALLGPYAGTVFNRLGLSPEQAGMQSEYFSILILGSGLNLLRGALSGFFCGIGRTRVVMVSAFSALVMNACAAWALIFGHLGFSPLGIRGAAFGAILGSLAGLGVLMYAYLESDNRRLYRIAASFRYDGPLMGSLLRFGYPSGVELLLNILAFNTIIVLLHSKGPVTATAATILFNWDLISFLPLVGIEVGVTSLVGRYVGARDLSAAHRAARSGLKLTWGFAAAAVPLFACLPHLMVAIFKPAITDPVFTNAAPLAGSMLRLAALYVVSNGILLVYAGALRGAGDTLFTMCMTVGMHWVMAGGMYAALMFWQATPMQAWALVVGIFIFSPALLWHRWKTGRALERWNI